MANKNDTLLVQLPPWDHRTVPLGIAYLATYLKSNGINTKVFDLNINMYNSESNENKKGWGNEDFHWWQSKKLDERYTLNFQELAERILLFNTRIIGFSATMPSIHFLNRLAKVLKKKSPEKIIIVGGPATFFKDIRKDCDKGLIDYFVIGEGERALYGLLRCLRPNGGLSWDSRLDLKIWKDKLFDKTICVQNRSIAHLDSVPYPTFEEFDLSQYTEGTNCTDFTLPIIFSKGCTKSCTFCSDRVLSYPYRYRDAKKAVEQIKAYLQLYPKANTFRLNDLSFNANLKFLNEFCDRIIIGKIKIKWYGQAQVRPDMSQGLLFKMKKAGCRQLDLGIENFSDHVLSMMKKGYNSKEATDFIKATKAAGIENNILLIVGYPGETEEDFDNNLEQIRSIAQYIDRIGSLNICGMPAGSELRNNPHKHNFFFPPEGDWVTTDYKNTYEVRKKRYNAVIKLCNELNILVERCLDLDIFEEVRGITP